MKNQIKRKNKQEKLNVKKYTAWHFYLIFLMKYLFKDSKFVVDAKVSVGTLPLELDIIIIEDKKSKNSKEIDKLPIIIDHLNKYTIIEFKSPGDSLIPEDYDKLRAYGLLYKIESSIKCDSDVTIMTISSTLSARYKLALKKNGLDLKQIGKGIYEVVNLPFRYVALELNKIGDEQKNNLLLMFSSKHRKSLSVLFKDDNENREIAEYVLNNILKQEVDNMRLTAASRKAMEKDISELKGGLKKRVLEELTMEERLKGVKVEDRLKGVKVEDIINCLSKKQREEFRKKLNC